VAGDAGAAGAGADRAHSEVWLGSGDTGVSTPACIITVHLAVPPKSHDKADDGTGSGWRALGNVGDRPQGTAHGSRHQKPVFPRPESLRGIASLSVVIGHSYVMTLPVGAATVSQPGFSWTYTFVSAIFDPQPAVLLFFVLSGFVLGLQLDSAPVNSAHSYIAYLLRRMFRLVPMMWFSSFFLKDFQINIVTWTLYVEIIASAVLPLLILVVGRAGAIVNAIVLAALLAVSILGRSPLTAQFLVFFYAGLLVGYIPKRMSRFSRGNAGLLLWISSIVIYLAAKYLVPGQMNWNYGSWQRWQWAEVGACGLIVYFVASQRFPTVQRFLTKPGVRFLGRISFSLYLLHLPVIYFVVKVMSQFGIATTNFERVLSFAVLATVVSAVTIPLSALTYWRVERPASDIGRHFASLIGKTRMPVAA
jgi:peptidoglycan/LPS O-acetylase OafA/YrhL